MTDDDAGLIALLMEWDKLESKELTPRVALHIAGHIEAMKAVIRAKDEEIKELREAGGDLGFYAGHDDGCDCVKGWAKGPCNCGYTETWNAWKEAIGEGND
jgi:hypothetical protein